MPLRHWLPLLSLMLASPAVVPAAESALSSEERGRIERELRELDGRLAKLRARTPVDQFADAALYAKGIAWALRYGEALTPADVALLKKALERGNARAAALEAGEHPWTRKKGKVVRAFVSAVDGSVQPCGVIVPARYDPAKPMRLDVVLHGSSRPVGMSELRFLARFDEGDADGKSAPAQDYIELHPLGRVENCYRWAGETDVFEAIEAACRNYNIDRDRVVLRGMSMGASGTWHLGLKHPERFVALGPYCGYVDTHRFSQTALPSFVKVGELPLHQEKALHMLDSIDYAANAGVVPAVACMGEKDVFFQAHVLMGEAMKREGLTMVNLISPGTGHVIDPVTHREQMRRIGEHAAKGIDHASKHLRFVAWTLKYNRCHWLRVLGLGEHYARAELEADVAADGSITFKEPKNITLFSVRPPVAPKEGARLHVGGRDLGPLPRGELFVRRRGDQWELATEPVVSGGKRPGVQGPIDDAFTSPFLCVRGTGTPWNPAVQSWSEASLRRFRYEWQRYFRGELPVKDDTAVTAEDVRRCNLILFGDPGSNRWIEKLLPQLPLRWTRDELRMGQERYPATDHAPILIQPNPLAEKRYVVLNSGHTFHEKELASLNYLLFPRLGDWAMMQVGDKAPKDPSGPLEEKVIRAGFFDERWQFAARQTPADAAAPKKAADELVAIEHRRRTIYHSPEKPGFTSWVGAWTMPDDSLMCCFTQATGPVKDRPRAPDDVRKKLNWPPEGAPGYDMTGLDLKNVHLRSKDAGETWERVSADSFKSCMNGVTGEAETALADGTVLRGVWGYYLPYNPELPKTGYLERSSDGTRTWGKPEVLLDPREYSAWPKRIRILRDGRLIVVGGLARVPANSRTRAEYNTLFEPLLLVSSDRGKTWKGPIPVVPEKQRRGWGGEEFDAAELANGNLLCVFRRLDPDHKGREVRWQGVLKKAGDSWEPGEVGPSPLAHSGHPELLATREGPILHLATNGTHWTTDAGKTWHRLNVPGTGYYPHSVQVAGGRIFVFGHVGSDDAYGEVDQSIVLDSFRLEKK